MFMKKIIITSPSLDPTQNVSGVSSVVRFIIDNNPNCKYLHFELGKKDKEKGGWHRITKLIGSFFKWTKFINAHSDALIHYNFPLDAKSIIRDVPFMYYALHKKHKMVVHIHGGLFLTSPKIPALLKGILSKVFSWNIPFIVLSDSEVKILKERFHAKNVYSLPNCVDLKDAELYAKEQNLKSEKALNLGYLGRIEPNKGMTELLVGCMKLKEAGIPFKLILAGKEQTEGEFLPRFKQSLGDNFSYVGLVSGKSKCDFLRSLDVLVMPTYFEGLPMSLLECMSYGVVPVITPVGSIPEVVVDGNNGLFIKVKDTDSIVDAISKINSDRNVLNKLSVNARETIFSKFSPQQYITQLNRIYQEG